MLNKIANFLKKAPGVDTSETIKEDSPETVTGVYVKGGLTDEEIEALREQGHSSEKIDAINADLIEDELSSARRSSVDLDSKYAVIAPQEKDDHLKVRLYDWLTKNARILDIDSSQDLKLFNDSSLYIYAVAKEKGARMYSVVCLPHRATSISEYKYSLRDAELAASVVVYVSDKEIPKEFKVGRL